MRNFLLGLFLPETCPACRGQSDHADTAPFCRACWAEIAPWTGTVCDRCGLPLASSAARRCSDCLAEPPAFRHHRSFGLYAGRLRSAIHELKYRGRRGLARPLGRLLADLELPAVDGIVPVPLHPRRLLDREFNQSALLARALARVSGSPLELRLLEKCNDTDPQAVQSRKERKRLRASAFRVPDPAQVRDRRILLVDDVCTTGATLNACSRALATAGARSVDAVTLARSTPEVAARLEPPPAADATIITWMGKTN